MAAQASPFFSFLGFHPAALAGAVNERLAAAQGLHLLEAASWAAGKATLGSAPADAAQKLFYTTVPKLTTRAERVAAARAAIAAGPCADAHTLLAGEEAKDVSEAATFTEEAVRIAQSQLNGALPAWELLPTRPYLRALHAHASVLLALGQPEKVITLLSHVPAVVTDVLNLQLLLVVAHLRREQWDAARRLIDARAVRPMSAAWLWLAAYQAEQAARASVDSANALARALKANAHVAPLVLKRRQPAPVPALSAAEGSEAEAELVVSGLRAELLESTFDGWVRSALAAGLGLHPCPNCAQTVSTALARMMRIDAHLKNKRFEEAEKEISMGGVNLPPMHPLKMHYLARYSELLAAHNEANKAKQIAHGGLHMDVIQFTKMASRQMPEKDKAEVVAAAELCTELNVPYRERLLAVWKKTAGSDFDPADHTECQKRMTEQYSTMTAQASASAGGPHGHSHGASGSHGHSHGPPAQCSTCGAAGKSLSLCGGCQRVAYCSRECQKKSWPEHKLICKQLAAGACAPGEHAGPAHGHSHNGQPCHGHGPQSHGHGGDSHGHSHNGQPCHGHGEQAQHGHGHGGGDSHGHSHNGQPCHGHGPQAPPPAQHGHSHNGQPCHGHGPQAPQQHGHSHEHGDHDHGHSHGDKSGGQSLHSLD